MNFVILECAFMYRKFDNFPLDDTNRFKKGNLFYLFF